MRNFSKQLTLAFALFIFFIATAAEAATYYVATTGSDTNAGTSAAPFKTIQKCANTAVAGDTCSVGVGTFYELVRLPASGTASSRIMFKGTRGSAGEYLTIVDGAITQLPNNWVPAPEAGPSTDVWKITFPSPWVGFISGVSIKPSSLVANGRPIWKIYESYPDDKQLGYVGTAADTSAGIKPASVTWWDGFKALWFYRDSTSQIYLRFQDGSNPNNMKIRIGPGSWRNGQTNAYQEYAPFLIHNNNYITISDFQIQGSNSGISISGTAANNIIQNCDIRATDGNVILFQTGLDPTHGPQNNVIQNNKIHGDALGYDTNPPIAMWYAGGDGSDIPRAIAYHQYTINKYIVADGSEMSHGILQYYASGTQVLNNEIYDKSIGIASAGSMTIANNSIHNFNGGTTLYFSGSTAITTDVYIHDNLFYEAAAQPFRSNDLGQASSANLHVYVYRNKIYNPTVHGGINSAYWYSFTGGLPETGVNSQAKLYNYHNTYIGGYFFFGLNESMNETVPGALFINNLIQLTNSGNPVFSLVPSFLCGDSGGLAGFNHNWIFGAYGGCSYDGGPNLLNNSAKIFSDSTLPSNWSLPAGSNARNAGIDVSKSFTINGVIYPPLPGFSPGYFGGTAPDIGAVQSGGTIFPTPTPSPTPSPVTRTYTLTCTGPGGTTSKSVSVNVTSPPPPFCSYFTASPSKIIWPSKSTLSWSCQNTQSCDISPTIGSVNPQSGTVQVSPSSTTTYFLSCFGAGSSIYETATVVEVVPPAIKEVRP